MLHKMFAYILRCRVVAVLLVSLGVAACELKDPVVVTYDSAEPAMLLNGSYSMFGSGLNFILSVAFIGSDEGVDNIGILGSVDETGDLSLNPRTESGLVYLSQSRELARMAVERAREQGDSATMRQGQVLHTWVMIEMARRWSDQPLVPRGKVYTEDEIYQLAVDTFDDVIAQSATSGVAGDSVHQWALAGKAWALWELGKRDQSPVLLESALDDVTELLAMNPEFRFGIQYSASDLIQMPIRLGQFERGEKFKDIPFHWEVLEPGDPVEPKLMDADGLRLIAADIQLGSNDLAGAKETIKAITLLPINHIGLAGRDPEGEPLSESEVDAFVDSLDIDGVRHAIDELWRENFFAQGRRNVGPNGPIYPIRLPPHAI